MSAISLNKQLYDHTTLYNISSQECFAREETCAITPRARWGGTKIFIQNIYQDRQGTIIEAQGRYQEEKKSLALG